MSLLIGSDFGFFSVLVLRLRAAAHALFPPRGEEKKSKVEAERHARETVANPVRHDGAVRSLALIVNPVAGGGRPARALPLVQAELRARGFDQRFEYTKSLGHARELAVEAAANGKWPWRLAATG